MNNEFRTYRGYETISNQKKILSSSMEDYLEMIYRQNIQDENIRINILSKLLNVNCSSVTKMVQKLSEINMIKYEKYGIIKLTSKGKKLGRYLFDRHNIVQKFLGHFTSVENILVETEAIEHNLSKSSIKRFDMFNKYIDENPQILYDFNKFLERKK